MDKRKKRPRNSSREDASVDAMEEDLDQPGETIPQVTLCDCGQSCVGDAKLLDALFLRYCVFRSNRRRHVLVLFVQIQQQADKDDGDADYDVDAKDISAHSDKVAFIRRIPAWVSTDELGRQVYRSFHGHSTVPE